MAIFGFMVLRSLYQARAYIALFISHSPQGNKPTEKNEILRGFPQRSLRSLWQKSDETNPQFMTAFSILPGLLVSPGNGRNV